MRLFTEVPVLSVAIPRAPGPLDSAQKQRPR